MAEPFLVWEQTDPMGFWSTALFAAAVLMGLVFAIIEARRGKR